MKQNILEVGRDDRNVIVNHPNLNPDADGVGHILFSPAQARYLAQLLIHHAEMLEQELGIEIMNVGDAVRWERYEDERAGEPPYKPVVKEIPRPPDTVEVGPEAPCPDCGGTHEHEFPHTKKGKGSR